MNVSITNEEREALTRARQWVADMGGIRDCYSWSDCKTLMEIALREHPADDDEPVTEEWLISLRWAPEGYAAFTCLVLRHERHVLEWFTEDESLWLNERCVHDNPTRGDVRRLCAALGVELKAAVTA